MFPRQGFTTSRLYVQVKIHSTFEFISQITSHSQRKYSAREKAQKYRSAVAKDRNADAKEQ